jgi:hypothetical protein
MLRLIQSTGRSDLQRHLKPLAWLFLPAGISLLLIAPACLRAESLRPQDWQVDPEGAYGGRSAITNGSLVYWTETPLATLADDTDDQQVLYYGGLVPASGPYELIATVHLPTDPFTPHDPEADLVPLYELGIVASGLVIPGQPETDLPALQAGIVYRDYPEFGVQAGDILISWEENEDGPPSFVRLDGFIDAIDLRVAFDGVNQLVFYYRSSGEETWTWVATQIVQLRGGPHARAELRGQSSNLVVPPVQGGRISDFKVVFARPEILSLAPGAVAGEWALSWNREPGATYLVWGSVNLTDWSQLECTLLENGEQFTAVHRPANSTLPLFYRLTRD